MEYRREIEEEVWLADLDAAGQREKKLKNLRQYCACCHKTFGTDWISSNLCGPCQGHAQCGVCEKYFDPDENSMGLLCGPCYCNELEGLRHAAPPGREVIGTREERLSRIRDLAFSSLTRCARDAGADPGCA
jgi:hypothetical protein